VWPDESPWASIQARSAGPDVDQNRGDRRSEVEAPQGRVVLRGLGRVYQFLPGYHPDPAAPGVPAHPLADPNRLARPIRDIGQPYLAVPVEHTGERLLLVHEGTQVPGVAAHSGLGHHSRSVTGRWRVARVGDVDQMRGCIAGVYIHLHDRLPSGLVRRVVDRQVESDLPVQIVLFDKRKDVGEQAPAGAGFGNRVVRSAQPDAGRI